MLGDIIPIITDPWMALLVAIAVLLGALIGSIVSLVTRFILPWDFFTVGGIILIMFDIQSGTTGIHGYWYLFGLLGYAFGYCIVGLQRYEMLGTIGLKGRIKIAKRYMVYYDHGERKCVQIQRWWPLFKRIFFRVHHYISSNVEELPDNCDYLDTFPLFRPKRRGTLAEWIFEKPAEVVKRWIIPFKQYDTYIFVAEGIMVPRAALAMRCDALDKANQAIDEMTKRWMVSETKGATSARRQAVNFIVDAKVEANPMKMLDNHLKSKKQADEDKKKKESEESKENVKPPKEEQEDG